MTAPRQSTTWHRVAALEPKLRPHVVVTRHRYRGQVAYVVRGLLSTQSSLRLSPVAYIAVGLMDGRRTLAEIWDILVERFGDEAPTQDQLMRLLGQLYQQDFIQTNVPPDLQELNTRSERLRRGKRIAQLLNPLSIRIPVADPDRLLGALNRVVGPVFGRVGLLAWVFLLGIALTVAALNWPELTVGLSDRVLAPSNLLLLTLSFLAVKVLHELGHGLAVKHWGGEVHEIGCMLLVFAPVPYVDASSATAFRDKWQRIVVGAAGMMVEIALAAGALVLWTFLEPGLLRSFLHNTIVVTGVSTIIFNANPLLRFDGYYILADWLEIPNLGPRSTRQYTTLAQSFILGTKDVEPVTNDAAELKWLTVYGCLSFGYRILVTVAIIGFVARAYPIVAAFVVTWVVAMTIGAPLIKAVKFLRSDASLVRRRFVAQARAAIAVVAVGALLVVVPFPFRTTAEGVVWLPEQAHVRANGDCFVDRILAQESGPVRNGDALLSCADPELATKHSVARARVEELEGQYRQQRQKDIGESMVAAEELQAASKELADLARRVDELQIHAAADGFFVLKQPQDVLERFYSRGETIGYVVPERATTARVVIRQSDIDLVRNHLMSASVRVAGSVGQIVRAANARIVPGGDKSVPSPALTQAGGGELANDPQQRDPSTTFVRTFEVEMQLDEPIPGLFGRRVFVRFDHGTASLGRQAYRVVRRALLDLFDA